MSNDSDLPKMPSGAALDLHLDIEMLELSWRQRGVDRRLIDALSGMRLLIDAYSDRPERPPEAGTV